LNLELHHYSVFAPEGNLEGGKWFALVDAPVPLENMPEIARESGAPLTAFITDQHEARVSVRFFNASGQEKPESDSGALVVAHHVGRGCTVVSSGGSLPVMLEDGVCWTAQGDHHLVPLVGSESDWLEALGLEPRMLETMFGVHCAGQLDKFNLIVPVRSEALDAIIPNLERVTELQRETGVNGVIVAAFDSIRANVDVRFFAPAKGILEDNAGSFTLASVCGYRAAHLLSGVHDVIAAQGHAMGRPSSLRARYIARDSVALMVRVGGVVREHRPTRIPGNAVQDGVL
jgi:PhzF family phenazine biosynthesis protein